MLSTIRLEGGGCAANHCIQKSVGLAARLRNPAEGLKKGDARDPTYKKWLQLATASCRQTQTKWPPLIGRSRPTRVAPAASAKASARTWGDS